MAKAAETDQDQSADQAPSIEAQAEAQTGQRQVRLRVDQKDMRTTYANAFRSSTTAEEVMIDFGLNQVIPTRPADQTGPGEPVGEILFDITDRIVLNYYTAKRLAVTLGQIIRRYEDQFGELKLNVAERTK